MIKKIFFLIIFNIIFLSVSSCGTIKEGFSSQKKNSNDEFLIEKKSPLLMPPSYGELPIPNSEVISKNDTFEKLITKSKNNSLNSNKSVNKSGTFEKTLLDKIKKN